MLTSKQRAYLRGLANDYEVILTVGKGGVVENVIKQANDALTARELIKGQALEASPVTSRQAADELAAATNSDVVQVIGRKFILYRRNNEKPVIELPKARKK